MQSRHLTRRRLTPDDARCPRTSPIARGHEKVGGRLPPAIPQHVADVGCALTARPDQPSRATRSSRVRRPPRNTTIERPSYRGGMGPSASAWRRGSDDGHGRRVRRGRDQRHHAGDRDTVEAILLRRARVGRARHRRTCRIARQQIRAPGGRASGQDLLGLWAHGDESPDGGNGEHDACRSDGAPVAKSVCHHCTFGSFLRSTLRHRAVVRKARVTGWRTAIRYRR